MEARKDCCNYPIIPVSTQPNYSISDGTYLMSSDRNTSSSVASEALQLPSQPRTASTSLSPFFHLKCQDCTQHSSPRSLTSQVSHTSFVLPPLSQEETRNSDDLESQLQSKTWGKRVEEWDVGNFYRKETMSDYEKHDLLKNVYKPPNSFIFPE